MATTKHILQDSHPAIISIRLAAIATSFTALIIFAWATTAHHRVFTDTNGASLCGIILGPISYALLWSLVSLTILLVLRRSVHPGIYIAFDFIAFGAVLGATIPVMLIMVPVGEGGYPKLHGPGKDTKLPKVEYFGYTTTLLNSVFHFILFVWACWACDYYRKRARKVDV
ncbi:hypothetical protein BDV25DRAFT_147583 [Aspergillus avenaceus]|uniref:MARVEL domain-containing protein n=1 Tax=Aspergillus avenaceus TaxID=36643 RepID=A0A5N6U7M9_ASPAV|nr:hypothetical protein BDV25DRAFT_147583 [Aspergillus avenaceus]